MQGWTDSKLIDACNALLFVKDDLSYQILLSKSLEKNTSKPNIKKDPKISHLKNLIILFVQSNITKM